MAEVTSDTVVKILLRRGLESERVDTLLSEGELGYSIDNRRIFVGDGITLGGNAVGNIFIGNVTDKVSFNGVSIAGDTVYENNILYARVGGSNWLNIHPRLYTDPNNGAYGIEYATGENKLRLSQSVLGEGFTMSYNPLSYNSLQQQTSLIQFDARYLSLCASNNSFYFGNIYNKTVLNNFNARVNVDNSFFINDNVAQPQQLQMYARNSSNRSSIESVSGDFDVTGRKTLNLLAGRRNCIQMRGDNTQGAGTAYTTVFSSNRTGYMGKPDFDFYGIVQFRDDHIFEDNVTVGQNLSVLGNSTIYGSLSVLGDMSYYDTIVSVTSTLSVVNVGPNAPGVDSVVIVQKSTTAAQYLLRIQGENISTPYFTIKDGPVASINYEPGTDVTYKLIVGGSSNLHGNLIVDNVGNAGTGNFNVSGNSILGGTSTTTLTGRGAVYFKDAETEIGQKVWFGRDYSTTNLYRKQSGTSQTDLSLKTDGNLTVGGNLSATLVMGDGRGIKNIGQAMYYDNPIQGGPYTEGAITNSGLTFIWTL
jgi:hypothetical protein